MQIANIDFKQRTAKFALSSGATGTTEKQLILDALNVWMTKQNNAIAREPNNSELSRQHSRFTRAIYDFTALIILDADEDFTLMDDETNLVTYNDLADAMTAINDQIRVYEEDGTYLTTNLTSYQTLQRLLSELNEMKTKFVRIPTRPQGLPGRKKT
jgi:hypothetical protein